MDGTLPRAGHSNARRLTVAAALAMLAVAAAAIGARLGGPDLLLRPSPADPSLSPAAAAGIAGCAAGLLAWAGGHLRAAERIGAAAAMLGVAALADAAVSASGGRPLSLAIQPLAASVLVLAGGLSFFAAQHAKRLPAGSPGVRVAAGAAALTIHAIGTGALLHRLFLGSIDPAPLLPPYGAAAFAVLGAGMAAALWDAESRNPRFPAWRGAIGVGLAFLWITGIGSFALLRQDSLRWQRERELTVRTASELFEGRIVDRARALHRLGERTIRDGPSFESDADLLVRDLRSIRSLAWVDASSHRIARIVHRAPDWVEAEAFDPAAEVALAAPAPETGLLRPADRRRPEAGVIASVPVRTSAGLAGVVVAVSDVETLFRHQLGSGVGADTIAAVSHDGRVLYRSDGRRGGPPPRAVGASLPFIGEGWELHMWWPSDPGAPVRPAVLLATTGFAVAALGALAVHLLGLARERAAALEQRTRELETSNRDLNDFAHAASHDLKAPLRAIENLATWIAEDAADRLPDESRRHLEQLRGRVQRLARLLDDMLQYARAGRLRAAEESIATGELVAGIVELLAPRSTLSVAIEPGMPTLTSQRAPLEQVFRNLLSNAIKHHDRLEGRVRVACRDLGQQVEFSVSDDGPGIEARHHERVFQMFQTLRPRDDVEGSGIGLALVRRLVETYGGRVVLESDGRGSTFRFRWPKGSPA